MHSLVGRETREEEKRKGEGAAKISERYEQEKREEEQKKKAEERAKKAAQKQADKEKKEAEKAAKQAEKMPKQAAKNIRQGSTGVSQKRPASSRSDQAQDRSTRPKVPKLSSSEHINPNQYCACFGLYKDDVGTGLEWLQCSCSRWIHEECVDNVVRGKDGEEKLCPLCLSAV